MRFRHVSASETSDHVSHTFLLSHFRSFLFPLRFWYFSGIFSFSFDRMIIVSEILPLQTIKVNKGKLTFEIAPLLGSLLLALVTLHVTTVRCARLPLLSILSDKNRREY